MRRINLFGGPGSGKSTLASLLFGELKLRGFSVELVNEYIKVWVYENRKLESFDQVYIFAKQQRLEDRVLRAGVKTLITDSPLLLQCVYAKRYNMLGWQELIEIAKKFDKEYEAKNLFIKRHDNGYVSEGRFQKTLSEAEEIDGEILTFLQENNIYYTTVEADVGSLLTAVMAEFPICPLPCYERCK